MRTLLSGMMIVLVACGGQSPRRFIASVDTTALKNLPTTCFPPNTATNSVTETFTDQNATEQFQVWTSSDGHTVLDLSAFVSSNDLFDQLTSAMKAVAGSSINRADPLATFESTDGKTFTGSVNITDSTAPTASFTYAGSVTVTFTDTSYSKGTIALTASQSCAGAGCPANFTVNGCTATVNFVASQVSGSNQVNF